MNHKLEPNFQLQSLRQWDMVLNLLLIICGCFLFQESFVFLFLIFLGDVIFDYQWNSVQANYITENDWFFAFARLVLRSSWSWSCGRPSPMCCVHLLSHILWVIRIWLDDPCFIIIYLFIASARAWWIWDYNVESDLRITSTWRRSSRSKLPAKTLLFFSVL